MSTDRQRVKRAIQRIAVQAPELQSLLKDAESKGGKPKSAGVGSSSEAQGDRVCCDGSVSDNANPGTGERDPDSGGQDGLDSNEPASLDDMGEGTLSGVTDCATGEPICFDGSGFIPPDGWDGPNEPPVDQYYDPDVYYRIEDSFGNIISQSNGCTATGSEFIGLWEDSCPPTVPPPSLGTICESTDLGIISSFSCSVSRRLRRVSCGSSPVCEEPPPTAESWPSDGCTNLIAKDGKIVGSKYDPENSSGDYSAPRDSIDLCSGGDQISLAPSADGGWKTINSTTDSGYLYNSKGEQIAHIDGNEYSDPYI